VSSTTADTATTASSRVRTAAVGALTPRLAGPAPLAGPLAGR